MTHGTEILLIKAMILVSTALVGSYVIYVILNEVKKAWASGSKGKKYGAAVLVYVGLKLFVMQMNYFALYGF